MVRCNHDKTGNQRIINTVRGIGPTLYVNTLAMVSNTVRYEMAGYNEYSKSNNAIDAEDSGHYPITKALEIVCKYTGIKKSLVRKIIRSIKTNEYHHTSKYYNITYYYDTENLTAMITAVKEAKPNFSFDDFDWDSLYAEDLHTYKNGIHEFSGMTTTINEILDEYKKSPDNALKH